MPRRLLIIQPYVPQYRVELFDALYTSLSTIGVELNVLAPPPTGEMAHRADQSVGHHWQITAADRSIHLFGKSLSRTVHSRQLAAFDGVIVGLSGTSLDAHLSLLSKLRSSSGSPRVGLWGHVGSYVKEGHWADLLVERIQMKLSDHIFAYTRTGAELAINRGVSESRVTALSNTVSTTGMLLELATLNSTTVDQFRTQHALKSNKTFAYVGGLDSAKRIDLLRDALQIIWNEDREVKVLIGGTGRDEYLLDDAVSRGQAIKLGRVGDQEKALIARCVKAMVIPGRIGLVAVEALALGTPIISTRNQHHAPEIEYLQEGQSLHFANSEPDDLAALMLNFDGIGPLDPSSWKYPTLDAMVYNFSNGIDRMLS